MYRCVRSSDEEFVAGPLTADGDISAEDQPLSDDNTTKPQPRKPSGPFVYRFQLWARFALTVQIPEFSTAECTIVCGMI